MVGNTKLIGRELKLTGYPRSAMSLEVEDGRCKMEDGEKRQTGKRLAKRKAD